MRDKRPIAGRMPRSVLGRNAGLPPPLPPGGHGPLNMDSGTPGIGAPNPVDSGIPSNAMLYESGDPMLYEDGATYMTYE